MAESLHALSEGRARPQALEQLTRWAEEIRGRGACRHPDGAALFVSSALRVFGDDLRRHLRDGPCAGAGREPILPTPVLPSGWR
jgi:NADH:ubiquinone oxidoreductase subunit F (NADH-binding)